MEQLDYRASIVVDVPLREAFEGVTDRIPEWWTSDYEGSAGEEDDIFIIQFGDTFTVFKIIEVVENSKIVWRVIDCHFHFLKNKKEWQGTIIRWEFAEQGCNTRIDMTHVGLVPCLECYEDSCRGWNFYAGKCLSYILNRSKVPQR